MRRLVDLGYGIVAAASAPIWLPGMIRSGKHRTDWAARFGRVGAMAPPLAGRRILVHAVSVGEVNATRLLIDELLRSDPPPQIVLAVTTDTGYARAVSLFKEGITVVRYPFDVSFAVERFLDAVGPDVAVLVELEVWPNFIGSCHRRGVPVCVINGRLTARSHRRYALLRSLIRRTFARLSLVAAQSEAYAARFRDLGTPADRVLVTGTMKWDTAEIADDVDGAEKLAQEMGIDRTRPLIVAGSTAPGEHELLDRAAPPGTQLLCAPRRPEWFDEAARALPGCVRRSKRIQASGPPSRFLLDTIGELRQAYALADAVVVGRTFVGLGGSDMMEPVALGKPVVIGPHAANFEETVEALLDAGGLIQTNEESLPAVLSELLGNPKRRSRLAANGRAVIRTNQGASRRHAELIRELLAGAVLSSESCLSDPAPTIGLKNSPFQHEAETAREEKEERDP